MELDINYKILIADDEPQNIKDLFKALNGGNNRVFVAPDGVTAVKLVAKHHPDAIIMDWDMPKMSGLEAIKIIRENESTKHIPIIVATGKMTSVENLRTALETGANDYIRKPYDPIEIEARIKSMIRLRQNQIKIVSLEKEIMQHRLEELNREIEINNQALSASKIRFINQCKKNDILIKELIKLADHTDKGGQEKISRIISGLKVDRANMNWQEFENHFEKVHPSFFNNLHKRYPGLTSNETELCIFIKLNMTTKEILAITSKPENTLKKSRQRLRKKLGLDADESLYNTIHEID